MKESEIKKILVVEDSFVNRQIACTMLKKRGLEIEEAEDGSEAIQKVLNEDFDIILMDIEMPKMDGYEAIDMIRNKMGEWDVPIILFTATEKNDLEKIKVLGINDILKKPIASSELDAILEKWLKVKKTEDNSNEKDMNVQEFKNAFEFRHIDIDEGIKYAGGSLKVYINTLLNFRVAFDEVFKSFGLAMLEREKITQKTFHVLKSNSGAIGAKRLSQLSAEIEAGSREEDTEFLKKHMEEVIVIMEDILVDILRMKCQHEKKSNKINKPLIIKEIEELAVLLDEDPKEVKKIFKYISDKLASRSDLFVLIEIVQVQIERGYYNDAISSINALKKKI